MKDGQRRNERHERCESMTNRRKQREKTEGENRGRE